MDMRHIALTEEELRSLLVARRYARRIAALRRLAAAGQEHAGRSGAVPFEPAGSTLSVNSVKHQSDSEEALAEEIGAADLQLARQKDRAPHTARYTPTLLQAGSDTQGPICPVAVPKLQPLPRRSWFNRLLLRIPWAVWRERALLLVEIAALLALIFVVAESFSHLDALNQEIAEARKAQAMAITDEELPGSSFPPALSNDLPVPVRPLVRPGAPMPIPTPPPQAATRIVIPSIGVDSAVVEGDTWEDLKKGVGHHKGTAHPGERGNAVYSGHNDVFGEVFRRLEEIKPGDLITMYAGANLYRYEVKRVRIVSPKEVSVMAPTNDATLTLITCYPYRVDTHRLVVIAKLVE